METAVAGAGAGAAVGEVTKCSIVHAEREFGYLVYFKRNKTNLTRKLQQLTDMTKDVQRLVDAAVNNTALIRHSVQTWLASAATAQEAGTQLIDEAAQVNSWFKGWCCSRFSIGRRAAKMIPAIQGLLDERTTFGEIVSDPKPAQSLPLISHGDFEVFASREFTTNQVLDALKDESINLVGVYGMPGAGKTMLVKALASHAKEEKMFEEVVTVIVSQNPGMKNIQGDIAKALSLHLQDDESISLRAERLSERLNQRKKTLVILDDLWQRVELSQVGIPWNTACKVLFTTRSQDVCNSMETQKKIEVTVLSEQDSWSLFREKAGGHGVDYPPLQAVARAVLKECGGLPLAIVMIGRAMRDKNANVWAAALTQLKKSIFEGMSPVISSIRLSYDYLPNQETKLCFLFCGFFPEDFKIKLEVLLWYLVGENVLRNVDSLEEARGRLHVIVDKLVSSCLLLEIVVHEFQSGNHPACMMHDVVRDAAIQIASEENEENHGFIVKARMNLTEWPDMELEKCKRLSLMSNPIMCVFPTQIRAPNLLTLSLNYNSQLKEIPRDFFSEMKSLLTLDLSCTAIELLPSSLSCLVNLCTLLLVECQYLRSFSPIESLEKLEILDLSRSSIEELPEEFGRLTNLKLLDLSDINELKTISPKLISSLSRLEELNVTSFSSWEIDETGEGRNASLSEIMSLTRLTSLRIHIKNLACLYTNTIIPNHWRNMSRFAILVADINARNDFDHWEYEQRERILGLQLSSSVCVADWVRMLLEITNCLILLHCDCLESVAQLDPTGLTDGLKLLYVNDCDKMRHLLGSSSSSTGVQQKSLKYALRNLEVLTIMYVQNFEAICDRTLPDEFLCKLTKLGVKALGNKIRCLIPSDLLQRLQNLQVLRVSSCSKLDMLHPNMSPFSSSIFPNLRSVEIEWCPKLKYIFPMGVFRHLLQLKSLIVDSCKDMEVIISDDNDEVVQVKEDDDKMILPRLEYLALRELPSLRSFSGRDSLVVCLPALQELRVVGCMNLKRLPLTTDSTVPKLKRLNPDMSSSLIFSNLQSLDIKVCPKLKYIFPMGIFRHLLQLKELWVHNCEDMEVIIYDDNDEVVQVKGEEDNNLILPRLEYLSLYRLPSLRSFSGQDSLVVCLPALEALTVRDCMNLKRLPFFTTDSVPKLKRFTVDRYEEKWFEGLEWEDQSLKSHLETLLDYYQ